MKKLPLFCLLSFVLCTSAALAYTSTDVSNAQFLADKGIIVKQSTTAGYRLDNTVTRAELVGIALKLKGVTLPSYKCKGYFSDVRDNNWICRAVEIAADEGLVTRANARFRAQDNITRAESLGILMSSRGIISPSGATLPIFPYSDVSEGWQVDMVLWAASLMIINNPNIIPSEGGFGLVDEVHPIKFYPNRAATRAEVFGFVRNTLAIPENEMMNDNTTQKNGWDLGWGYTKDLHNVYYNNVILPGINPDTFQLYENDYLSDKSGFYKYFKDSNVPYRMPNIDKNSFTILTGAHVKDNNTVYHCNGFAILIGETNTYNQRDFKCVELMADAATFVCRGQNDTLCEDKDAYFNQFGEKTYK